MINIKELTLGFPSKIVLENINLDIPENEITTIVGKSGVGKSVLIKSLLNLIPPISGEIVVDNKTIASSSRKENIELRKKFSILFQNSALLDSLNIFYNVSLPLREHTKLSKSEIKEITLDTLRTVNLEQIEDLMPSELSGGMKKRAALARAIILKPKYLIYDEPTTGLDPIIASEIMDLILEIQNQMDITSIIITHDIRFLDRIGGKVIMLKDKQIYFEGSTSDFLTSTDKSIQHFRDSY